MNPFHTPEELQYFTSLAHWLEGGILGIVVIVAFLQIVGLLKIKKAQLIWSLAILIAGAFLVPYMLLHHGLDRIKDSWIYIINDPEQRQHLIMGILLMIAGAAELLFALKPMIAKVWNFIFPVSLIVIGIMFMVHNQHGTSEVVHQLVVYHRYLGSMLILSGLAKAISIWKENIKIFQYLWILFLLITSIMLISYKEPNISYNTQPDNKEQTQTPHNLH